jgi:hypothetical protein
MSGRPLDLDMLSRCLRRYAARIGDGALHELPDLVRLADMLDRDLTDAVARLRAEPWAYSWSQIGAALGISRQAAQQRFAKVGGARRPGGQPAGRR